MKYDDLTDDERMEISENFGSMDHSQEVETLIFESFDSVMDAAGCAIQEFGVNEYEMDYSRGRYYFHFRVVFKYNGESFNYNSQEYDEVTFAAGSYINEYLRFGIKHQRYIELFEKLENMTDYENQYEEINNIRDEMDEIEQREEENVLEKLTDIVIAAAESVSMQKIEEEMYDNFVQNYIKYR